VFQNNVLAGAAAASTGAYTIDNSCRFNINDTAYLARDVATTLSNKFTYSFWVKRCTFGTYQYIVTWRDGSGAGSPYGMIQFNNDDTLSPFEYDTASSANYAVYTVTDAVFRDPSAWYHIVVNFDYTRSTSDRVRVYANGTLQTFGTNENSASAGTPQSQATGSDGNFLGVAKLYNASTQMGDFYMAEVHLVSDAALAASEFGETNSNGVWVPKEYSGSYGDEGHFLDFESSGDLGNDVSGNNNDFTSSGLAAADQMEDTPTNNQITYNPLNNQRSGGEVKDGNLVYNGPGTRTLISLSANLPPTGKYAVAFKTDKVSTNAGWDFGITKSNNTNFGDAAGSNEDVGANDGLNMSPSSSDLAIWDYVTTGDIDPSLPITTSDEFWMAVDMATGKCFLGIYDASATSMIWVAADAGVDGNPATGANPTTTISAMIGSTDYVFAAAGSKGDENLTLMKSADISGTIPTGYTYFENVADFPTPAVTDPSEYYQTGPEYAGNGSTQTITFDGNADMQPDIVWIKATDGGTKDHVLTNSVRGTGFNTVVNLALAEDAATDVVTAFNTDGFSLGDGSELFKGSVNGSSINYVSWNWKESATSGMDIVTWTGNATNRTISHSLGVVPKFMVVRGTSARDWIVYHSETASDPSTAYMRLDTEAAVATESTIWNDTMPTSSVFSIGTGNGVNANTETYIGYLFAEIEGFSRFSIYTGTGNANGPFIYCGFRPQLVIIKKRAGGGANIESWNMYDTTINPYNTGTTTGMYILRANDDAASAQASNENIDILSNGFKIRSSGDPNNGNTDPYLVMAWAYNPFGGDGSAPAPAR